MATAQGPDGKEQPANGHWLIIGKHRGEDCWISYGFVNMPVPQQQPAPEGGCGSRCVPHPSDFRARVADRHHDCG